MLIEGNITLAIIRSAGTSESTHEERALDAGDYFTLEITADIEQDDIAEYELPNGKTKTVRVTKVMHHQSPFDDGSDLNHIQAFYTSASRDVVNRPHPVELPGLHAEISRVAGTKWAQGHTDSAVFEAFKLIESRVQRLTGSPRSGYPLMNGSFGKDGVLDVSSSNATGQSREDEQDGFRNLFAGGSLGIRNPRGHGDDLETSASEAMEMLSLASLLMRRLDLAEARNNAP